MLLAMCVASVLAPALTAQPVQEETGFHFGLLHDIESEIGYKLDGFVYGIGEFDVKRSITAAYIGYGDLFIAGGVIHETEVNPGPGYTYPIPLAAEASAAYSSFPDPQAKIEGDGFVAAIGVRAELWQWGALSIAASGQLSHQRESCDATHTFTWYDTPVIAETSPAIYPPIAPPPTPRSDTVTTELDLRTTELTVSVVAGLTGRRHTLYLGLELIPFSDIEADVDVSESGGPGSSSTYDIDRDQTASFILGWQAHYRNAFLLVESRTGSEKSLRAGAGLLF